MTLPTVCVTGAGSSGIAAEALHQRGVFHPSKRHTMQVDSDDYLHELRRERRRGQRRAAAGAPA